MKESITKNYKLNIEEVFNFIEILKKEKNFSENTIDAYLKDLKIFFDNMPNKTYKNITEEDILKYIEKMREDYTQNTVYRKLLSIKIFFKYLYTNKKINMLITENLKSSKQQSHIPEILTEEEVFYILENCDSDEKGKRDLVIIKLLYETGILISDILKLKIEDINEYKYINYGSSKKSYVVTLEKELAEIIKEYIDTVWLVNYKNKENLLFPALSRQNFAARLKKYAAKAGITRSIYPNMFRNTLAVNLLDNGRNIRDIKDRLNYVNISKTGIYNIRNKNDIKEIYDKIAIGDWNVSEDF